MKIGFSVALFLILPVLIWNASRIGFASLLTTYAKRANQLDAANAAVNLSPSDAEAHYVRAAILELRNDLAGANAEYQRAAVLRPADYVFWLDLMQTREASGDLVGAIAAGTKSVQLAPYYAQPHWRLGNLLVRAGRADEGFRELRLAGASNPPLQPAIIDLAWQLSHGDLEYVRRAIQPSTPETYLALADHFKKHGNFSEAIVIIAEMGSAAADYRARFIDELISAKRFGDAYKLWSNGHPGNPSSSNLILDSGFEEGIDLDEPGFGWRGRKTETVLLSLEAGNSKEGKSSLRIEFKGNSEPSVAIISQFVMVEPQGHYELHFAARTEELISGQLPGLRILDASSGRLLAQTDAFPKDSNGWRDYSVKFIVPENSPTVQIAIQREPCGNSSCPIFGRIWLDSFSLQKQ